MNLRACVKILPLGLLAAGLYLVTGCDHAAALNQSTANVKHITQTEFEAEVTRATNTIVADFYATWCGPCQILTPMLDRLAGGYTDKLKFIKINVDESPGLAQNFHAGELPLMLLFKDGKVAGRFQGLPTEAELKARLDAFVAGK
ncbi:MAG: thioredoxin domain-containing protein [Verrucomicrobiae bacterium]|nr:thioredoxin domain-containing protein [Verrucomicrobiae bacterium]